MRCRPSRIVGVRPILEDLSALCSKSPGTMTVTFRIACFRMSLFYRMPDRITVRSLPLLPRELHNQPHGRQNREHLVQCQERLAGAPVVAIERIEPLITAIQQ